MISWIVSDTTALFPVYGVAVGRVRWPDRYHPAAGFCGNEWSSGAFVESLCFAGGTAGREMRTTGSAVPSERQDAASGDRRVPAKAKTIAGYLGPGYVVEASFGHVRDLPRNAADVPAKHKGQAWARLGVDVDNDFAALYVISPDRKKEITRLKSLLKDSDELLLATDEDREGEAIAWHLVETLKPKVPIRRMVFHEITRSAIQAAVANPREIDRAGRRPGGASHPRPALRLRGLPGAVEEGHAEAVGRPGAVGGDPDRGPARARADEVPRRRLLGHPGHPGRRRERSRGRAPSRPP